MSSEENRPKLVCIPEVIFFNQEYPILMFPKLNAHLREKKEETQVSTNVHLFHI